MSIKKYKIVDENNKKIIELYINVGALVESLGINIGVEE